MNTKTIIIILLVLIAAFITLKYIRHSKSTDLHDAASKRGGTAEVEKLISEGENVNAKDKKGMTALHESCFLGHIETVKLLIQKGADVNARNNKGETPLHFAAEGGMPEIAKMLLDAGADVNAKTKEGKTPIDYVNNQIKLLEQMTAARPSEGPGKGIATSALNQVPDLLQRYKACAKVLNDKKAKQ
jgi:ankyrin repeat protein